MACALAAAFILCACSSDDGGSDASNDATKKPDAHFDATSDVDIDAACGPLDVSTFQPTTLVPPNPPHAGACSTQQVGDYAQCQGAGDTSLCQQFADGQSGQTCRMCIETQTTDSKWGVIVFAGSGDGVFNIEGCVDDALSETTLEKASGGAGSCGDLLHASYGCQDAACTACGTGDAFTDCVSSARAGQCKAYDTAVEATTGPCAALLGDAAPADASDCFPNPALTDPTQQEVDWLTRMVGYMCGS
jgi:hypothetical protein